MKLPFPTFAAEGGDSGGGAGESAAPAGLDLDDPAVSAAVGKLVASAVEKEVAGLKRKNSELLGAQKQLKERLRTYEDAGGDEAIAELERRKEHEQRSEIARLFAEGKEDEARAKLIEPTLKKHERDIGALVKERDELRANWDRSEQARQDLMLSYEIREACGRARVRPEHEVDIANRLRGRVVRRDEQTLVLDEHGEPRIGAQGRAMTIDEAIDELREPAPTFFQPSSGAGARSSLGGGVRVSPDAVAGMSLDQYRQVRDDIKRASQAQRSN